MHAIPTMKVFLNKHKRTILFWVIFVFIILYFAPRQSEYYLDKDVRNFKIHYLQPTLIWTGSILIVGLLIFWLKSTKSIMQLLTHFISVTFTVAAFLFIFQDLFLAASLFINRQIKKGAEQKRYTVIYTGETEKSKKYFIPYDLDEGQISIDKKLINKLYKTELKQNDTITLKFDRGLFGIAFQSNRFDDN
jgi:hypothetical protein